MTTQRFYEPAGWRRVIRPMVGALLLAAAACYGETGSPSVAKAEAPASAVVNFRLKWFIYSSFAHHLVAAEEGFYAKEGLDVKIHPGGAGLDPIWWGWFLRVSNHPIQPFDSSAREYMNCMGRDSAGFVRTVASVRRQKPDRLRLTN